MYVNLKNDCIEIENITEYVALENETLKNALIQTKKPPKMEVNLIKTK